MQKCCVASEVQGAIAWPLSLASTRDSPVRALNSELLPADGLPT
jgi:hypothetical protein